MSIAQRQAFDAALRAHPEPSGPLSIEQQRQGFAALMASFPIPDSVRQTETELGGRPAIVVEPEGGATRQGTILYFHGGFFSLGSPATALSVTANLVARTGVRAVSLDYRLAPEHPYPAAIYDGVAAYRQLLDDGRSSEQIVFTGDSAGGGLTVTTTLAAREAGLPAPAGLVAFSPMFDHTDSGATIHSKEGVDPFFTAASIAAAGRLYLAGADPRQPLLAPALVGDLTGLPPMLLQVGTNELLLDDAVRMAARARDAEVDVILDVVAGVPHVFPAYLNELDEAGQALDRAALFITQRLT